MDPAYRQIRRLTQNAKYWVINTFEAKFRILTKAQETSQERVKGSTIRALYIEL